MPWNTAIETLLAQSEAFYATHGRNLRAVPADEAEKQRKREKAILNADPETLDITCIAMKNRHSEADDRKLRGSPLAGKREAA